MPRIIAGEFGSRRLEAPAGLSTRPTLDRTRESLFNILQPLIPGRRVLDLFAGSGALGLEALSRGAQQAVFVDKGREAAACVRRNIDSLGVGERSRLLVVDWQRALAGLADEGQTFDLILLDPPYDLSLDPVLSMIGERGLLNPKGLIVAEHDRRSQVHLPAGLAIERQKAYGDTRIDFLRRTDE